MPERDGSFDAEVLDEYLVGLDATSIPQGEKGFASVAGLTARQIVELRMPARGLGTPLAVINEATLRRNVSTVQSWCEARSLFYAPHVKTTMSPHIVAHQLKAGAWGVTVATVTQAAALAAVGVRRIMIANQVVDDVDVTVLQRLRIEHPTLSIFCLVDSHAGVAALDAALVRFPGPSEPLAVLVEMGVDGGRAGVRTDHQAVDVAQSIVDSAGLRLAGATGFEGVLGSDQSTEARERVAGFLENLVLRSQLIRRIAGADHDPSWICSAGGSLYVDRVAEVLGAPGLDHTVVVRSGGLVTHDDTYLGASPPELDGMLLAAALEVRASVFSIPEPGLAILGIGKRDVGNDIQFPNLRGVLDTGGLQRIVDHRIVAMNDHHAYLRAADRASLHPALTVGSHVSLGIAHPCTTFDKWRRLALVDDSDQVVGVYTTLF